MVNKNKNVELPFRTVEVRDAVLPNKKYYGKVDTKMDKRAEPTVKAALRAMRKGGNKEYHEAFGTALEKPLNNNTWQPHEIAHLAPRIGHTMQQEAFQDIFQEGLLRGPGVMLYTPEEVEHLHFMLKAIELLHQKDTQSWNEWRHDPASNMNRAVNFAAGMYLRGKIDLFVEQGMLDKPYARQKKFCENYLTSDEIPPLYKHDPLKWIDIGKAPYPLIQFSPQEWRAIEAVALGICKPEQTLYPKRLTAVKDALEHVGMFYDRPKSMADRVKQKSESAAQTPSL